MTGKHDLVIKGGHVVLPDGIRDVDIAVQNGTIVEIREKIEGAGQNVIHAAGNYVLPGMIDIHVHFNEPHREDWEGFASGSSLVAAGGCTTYFDMPLNGVPPTTTKAALLEKIGLAAAKSYVDYALWGGLVPGNETELESLAAHGVIGFKAFMSSSGSEFANVDDVTLYRGMDKIASLNKVLALHAESEAIVQILQKEKTEQGLCSARDYMETRPIIAELEAVNKALLYVEETGCPLHFVHISSYKAIQLIERAKKIGVNVTVETCPHYLLFTDKDFERMGPIAKCAPPLRAEEERVRLWEAIRAGMVDMISSDHSPCPTSMKKDNEYDMMQAWGGISGGQFTMEAMIDEGCIKQGIPLTEMTRLLSTNPALRFGLYPQKGIIAEGSDADLVIVNMNTERTIKKEELLSRHKHSPYIGRTLHCAIEMTINRGRIVYQRNEGIKGNPAGRLLYVPYSDKHQALPVRPGLGVLSPHGE
jgi:allantoinase